MDQNKTEALPDLLVTKRWKRIPNTSKAAFFSCFAAGMIVHLFAFANVIPNSDGLSRIYDLQQMTISGRWFLHFATALNGYTQLPALIGFLSVLLMSLAAGIVASLFRMKNGVIAGLIGIFMIAFPSTAYTYLYMFTASAYFLGVFLAVAGVWLAERYKFGLLPGALLLACAVGTYQAYAAVAASLSLLVVLFDTVTRKRPVRETLKQALRHLLFLIAGMILYLIILRIFLTIKDLELISYLGMDSAMGGYPFAKLPGILWSTYTGFAAYFLVPGKTASYATVFVVILNGLVLLTAVILSLAAMAKSGIFRNIGKLLLVILMVLLVPAAVNLVEVISPFSEATPIMRYSFVFVYVFAAAILDAGLQAGKEKGRGRAGELLLIPLALLLVAFAYVDNLAYLAAAQAHRATESFATRLVERVETTEGYQNGMEVVIIGAFPQNVYHSDIPAYDLVEHYSCSADSVLSLNKHVYYYLNDWLNVPWQEPDENTMISVSESTAFQAMPLYPDDGSVAIEDGRVIVRLSESYTPKKPYEIEYESRR